MILAVGFWDSLFIREDTTFYFQFTYYFYHEEVLCQMLSLCLLRCVVKLLIQYLPCHWVSLKPSLRGLFKYHDDLNPDLGMLAVR